MKTLLLVALIAIATASYFEPTVTTTEQNQLEEPPFQRKDQEFPMNLDQENFPGQEQNERQQHMRGRKEGRQSQGRTEEGHEGCHGRKGRQVRGGRQEEEPERPQRPERPERPDGHHPRRPDGPDGPDGPKDEFAKQTFDTLRNIGHGILDQWRLAEDAETKNAIRAELISQLENLLPVAEDPVDPVDPEEVQILEQEMRITEEGGN